MTRPEPAAMTNKELAEALYNLVDMQGMRFDNRGSIVAEASRRLKKMRGKS